MVFAKGGSPRGFVLVVVAVLSCLAVLLYSAKMVAADQMVASWYGPGFEGATTASGEPFDATDYTAAHKTLPFGTKLTVTLEGRSVVVRVNDRGPFVTGRDLDLSQAAAEQIGLIELGEATVSVATADPSTPTGPVSGAAEPAPVEPAPEAAPAPTQSAPEVAPAGAKPGAGDANTAGVEQYAAKDQYDEATGDQYSNADDQYAPPKVEAEAAPAPTESAPEATSALAKPGAEKADAAGVEQYATPKVAPETAPAPVAPPVPDPSRLETPPAELATPGSTVERRIVLVLAVPPPEYEGPAPGSKVESPEPEKKIQPKAAPKVQPQAATEAAAKAEPAPLTVLPDTGGASLAGLASGVLLVGLGAAMIRGKLRVDR